MKVILSLLLLISLAGTIYPFKPFKKRWIGFFSFIIFSLIISFLEPTRQLKTQNKNENQKLTKKVFNPKITHWVTVERINRRTCPSTKCGVVGQIDLLQGVKIFEERNGWARITKFYDAFCINNKSRYVDEGNDNCTEENGIFKEKFAEWVLSKYLSKKRPLDPAKTATTEEKFIAQSDDFKRYRNIFLKASLSLIKQGRCIEKDFYDNGGWVKSFNYRNKPIYFTYCQGESPNNRIYLNVNTQKTFK